VKFLRHLLAITKLDKETGGTERSKGKTVPTKMITTRTKDGHK
jgi:hypothetical protein